MLTRPNAVDAVGQAKLEVVAAKLDDRDLGRRDPRTEHDSVGPGDVVEPVTAVARREIINVVAAAADQRVVAFVA